MKNTVTQEDINNIIENSHFFITTVFEKCTVVICQLPSGFIITESSACVDKINYDAELGEKICRERIKNKVWELEGYKLQCELAK
ncbi:Gp49 family protein [Bacillus toyonensis]|uniref:Gp49 family protein n=1 Tax=Bacillus toyonensis TaxID=155322 RepID=UPI000BECB9D5|nr:Gp49 family protein [Bacillus toyonensis]PDY91500.1 hypothetical protein CON67_10545 [Bacillus toyonensis]